MDRFSQLREKLKDWLAQSIGNRIMFAAAMLASSFIILFGLVTFFILQALVEGKVEATLAGEAKLASNSLRSGLTALNNDLQGLSANSMISNALVDSVGRFRYVQPFLDDHRPPVKTPFRLSLADHTGNFLVSNNQLHSTTAPRELIREVVRLGKPLSRIEKTSHGHHLHLVYPVIYPATGMPEGAMALELPLSELEQELINIDKSYAYRSGIKEDALLEFGNTQSLDTLLSYRESPRLPDPISELELWIEIGTDRNAALLPVRLLFLTFLLSGFIALALVTWLARKNTDRLISPLLQLTRMADAIRSNPQLPVQLPMHGHDEIAQLTAALQLLIDRYQNSQDTLEKRVEERTAELQFAESRLHEILNNMGDGLITLNETGHVETANHSAEHIFNRPASSILGCDINDLFTDTVAIRQFLGGQSEAAPVKHGLDLEVTGSRLHDGNFPAEISVRVLNFREQKIFICIVRDITERKRNEQLKTDFISVVSHELRTPLTAIRGALGLVTGGMVGSLPDKAREMLDIANNNSERLSRLINDLLDIQKLEAGGMQFDIQEHALHELLQEAIRSNKSYADRLDVSLSMNLEIQNIRFRIDSVRLQQVLANLISNACKFSPARSTVTVSATTEPGYVRISVKDQGQGIPEEFRERIFEKFTQADSSTTRNRDGTGLGLAISKSMIEHMGGQLDFESSPGNGTTFYIKIPA